MIIYAKSQGRKFCSWLLSYSFLGSEAHNGNNLSYIKLYDTALDQAKCSTLRARRDALCTKTFDKMRRPDSRLLLI
jgi:hypothetical protein